MLRKIIYLLCLFPLILSAQEEDSDKQLWLGATYKLDLNKDWRFEIEEQARFSQIYSGLTTSFTELGLRYEVTGNLDIKGQYRFEILPLYRNEHRLSLDLTYGIDPKNFPLEFDVRVRIQDATVSYTGEKKTKLRGRLSAQYNLSSWADPFMEFEKFFDLNQENEFSKNRYTIGMKWRLSKWWELESFYRLEEEINSKNPVNEHIAGFSVVYSMDWDDFK